MDKHHSKIIILLCLLISILGIVWLIPNRKQSSPIPPMMVEAQTPAQTPVISSDGKFSLTLEHSLILANLANGGQKELLAKTASTSSELLVPANTFSPDDKYVFLKQVNFGQTDYFALRIADTSKILDISGPFAVKYPDFVITDVTGWGGTGLIVVNTDKVEGGIGPSFWFDVYTQSFIRLSTRFN